jgi:amino acid transporter
MATISESPLNQTGHGKTDTKGGADIGIDIERSPTPEDEQHGTSKEIPSAAPTAGYHRSLTRRKVMMMTFGAGIGTGLWVGTGQALYYGMWSLAPFSKSSQK